MSLYSIYYLSIYVSILLANTFILRSIWFLQPKTITKTNQSPVQYFSTPLPMRVNDFERFLKENQIDVQSVTTPLVGLPQMVLNKTPAKSNDGKKKYTSNAPKSKASKDILVTPSYFVTINPLNYITLNKITANDVNNELTLIDIYKNKYKHVDDKRQKRYSEIRNERFFTFEPFRKKTKAGKEKKKIKLFDKTTPIPISHYTVIDSSSEDDNMENVVELTIINMNDIEPDADSKQVTSQEKVKTGSSRITTRANVDSRKKVSKTKSTKFTDETTSFPLKPKHNNLLYKHKDKMKEKIVNPSAKVWIIDDNIVTDDFYTTTFHPMINHELFSNLNAKHHPKRVRISSHSYKYDIIYNNEQARHGKHAYRGRK